MPVLIKKFKFKKLLNEYKSHKYELKLIREVLKDAHLEFEVFYRRYCAENNIDLGELTEKNQKAVDMIFQTDETGIVANDPEPKKKESKHKSVHREIARKIHPDKLESSDPRFWEYTNDLKTANESMNTCQYGDLFEIADKYEVYLGDYDEVYEDLQKNIDEIKEKIKLESATYSYALYECGENEECKEKVVRNFLWQIFKWK